jgi:hypothetical protein
MIHRPAQGSRDLVTVLQHATSAMETPMANDDGKYPKSRFAGRLLVLPALRFIQAEIYTEHLVVVHVDEAVTLARLVFSLVYLFHGEGIPQIVTASIESPRQYLLHDQLQPVSLIPV